MFTDLARMDAKKCVCSCVCFCFLFVSIVTAMPNRDKQVAPLKCLTMGKTRLKLCIDDIDHLPRDTDPSWELPMQRKRWDNIPSSRTFYNKHMLTDYGGMIVPFFMRKRSRQQSDVPFQSILSFKMADGMDGSPQSINKRPFDSISYNTGLGGFK
ncbi:uncharacterized protein LOC123526362 [Mercenaria mercenaria]|uniref:uncharacterized protein LOC123526362 n=1 Tax=Mercenaria mercenaria TaxID=6596 RepID=UPI00234E696D|nr:uncharacterized protein LOC123526362 [Mercenaria mercenaria]